MKMLEDLRQRFSGGEKVDSFLYLSARMHDAEDDRKESERRVVATERAATDILRRYDADGSLIMEFRAAIDRELSHLRR